MAYFDDSIECMNKIKKKVRVPSNRGGADRSIYVNGDDSGYYLGKNNETIYRAGREVSTATIRDFAKQHLGFFIYSFKSCNRSFYLKNNK